MAESAYWQGTQQSGTTYAEYSKQRIDRLSEKSRNGTIVDSERVELAQLVQEG